MQGIAKYAFAFIQHIKHYYESLFQQISWILLNSYGKLSESWINAQYVQK